MDDSERAAKAARAKAMLKKHQAKKAGTTKPSPLGATELPGSQTHSPAVSPPPSEAPVDEYSNPTLNNEPDHPRPALPIPPRSQTPGAVIAALIPPSRPRTPQVVAEDPTVQLRELIQTQQQTIILLVSEKASLSAALEQLEDVEADAQKAAHLLETRSREAEALQDRISFLESSLSVARSKHDQLATKEGALTEKHQHQERELEQSKRTVNELRSGLERSESRVRGLEQRIQSDDRVENLENSLKNVESRAESLELQLSKSKQATSKLKTERDDLEEQLRLTAASETEWKRRHTSLSQEHSTLAAQLASITTERDTLATQHATVSAQLKAAQASLADSLEASSKVSGQLLSTTRQLEALQLEVVAAARRGEDAENALKGLQTENVDLMASLNEMRPKLVELTDTKLDLGEKVARLEASTQASATMISQLEASLDEAKWHHEEAETDWKAIEAARDQAKVTAEKDAAEMHAAYSRIEEELKSAHASVRELEVERASRRQEFIQHQTEMDRLSSTAQLATKQAAELQAEVEERRHEAEETKIILAATQTEVEGLRAETEGLRSQITSQQDEVVKLREQVSRPASTNSLVPPSGQTLNEEMLLDNQQRHELEVSNLRSQIRNLETELFDGQKNFTVLQRELSELKALPHPSGTTAFMRNHHPEMGRRESEGSTITPRRSPSPRRSIIDANLPPEIRHKRRVSLSMLKARMDSERGVASLHHKVRKDLSSTAEENASNVKKRAIARHQFLDESHVFWCHSCRGDLVSL